MEWQVNPTSGPQATKPKAASDYVDGQRLWQRHLDMARLGATGNGGVRRLALTAEDNEARGLLATWAANRNFDVSMDAIGNVFVRREGTDSHAAPVLTGSHLDSQPTGGKFDGTYGVLAALEALEAIDTAGFKTRRPIEVVSWTNEEGCRFVPGCTGSLVYRTPADLQRYLVIKDVEGISLGDAVRAAHAALPTIRQRPLGGPVWAFVEAHIEQGPELERQAKTIGAVTGIQGTRRFEITVHGEDAHAGTTPRRARKDALSAAVAMVAALEQLFYDKEDTVRFTVGRFEVWPNAPSVVPGKVFFTIDFRHPDDAVLTSLGDQVASICETNRKNSTVDVKQVIRTPPIKFPERIVAAVELAAQRLGLPTMRIASGAAHDAQNLFHLAPTGMIFVPCEKGISHNERENAQQADLTAGARVLADVILDLANE
jgi:N-carbamoyl-L-amino-acid hydrolase